MPSNPIPGQRRPDAHGRCPGRAQVAINGGCWVKVESDARDCDEESYVHKGRCYMPVFPTKRPAIANPAVLPAPQEGVGSRIAVRMLKSS